MVLKFILLISLLFGLETNGQILESDYKYLVSDNNLNLNYYSDSSSGINESNLQNETNLFTEINPTNFRNKIDLINGILYANFELFLTVLTFLIYPLIIICNNYSKNNKKLK